MSYVDISAALNTQLATISGFTGLIAWPNTKFNPSDGVKYIEPLLLPNESDNTPLGSSQAKGIYQVLCKRRLNKGVAVLNDVDAVRALFPNDGEYTSNSVTVRIVKSWASPPFIDGDWHITPVSISWYSFILVMA